MFNELVKQVATGLQPEFHQYVSGGLYKNAIVLYNPGDEDIQVSEYSVRIFSDNSWKTQDGKLPLFDRSLLSPLCF